MKVLIVSLLAIAAIVPAQADPFRPHGRSEHGRAVHFYSFHNHAYVRRHWVPEYHSYSHPPYSPYGRYHVGYSLTYPVYGSATTAGTWIGALAGGIIGNNSSLFGHQGWRGAAWGAGAGWLLGSMIDAGRSREEPVPASAPVPEPVVVRASVPVVATTAPVAGMVRPAPVASPMSEANALFGR